jgi:hypothetical protein
MYSHWIDANKAERQVVNFNQIINAQDHNMALYLPIIWESLPLVVVGLWNY